MADNVELNSGSGGATLATDDIAGVQHQRVKIQYGVDGSATDVSDTNPLPIDDAGGSITVDDGGTSLTVDGTVTANLSATDNAVLDTIETNTDYGTVTGGGTESGALRVTLANDSTGVVSVDDNGGSLTVDGTVTANLSATDNAVLDNIDTQTATLAGAVHNEDAAHTTGDAGIQSLAVRNDSDTSLAGTTGDYTPLQVDSSGFLKVNIKAGAGSGGTASTDDAAFTAGSGSGTPMMGFATSDTVDAGDVGVLAMDTNRNLKVSIEADNAGIGGGTQYTEDAAAAADPVGNMNMAVRADSLGAVTSTDGDNIALRATNNGELYVKQTDAVPVTDNGGSLTVDGTVTANAGTGTFTVDGSGVTQPVSGTVTANLSATDNAVLDTIETNTDYGTVTGGGTETGALRVTLANNSTGVLSIDDNGGSITVDNGGTFATQATLQTGSNLVGDVGISGARTSGGTTMYRNIDVDESEDQIKGTAGQVYWIQCSHIDATPIYLHFYNATAASVTVGTTTPDLTFLIPTQGDSNGAGFVLNVPNGIAFSTAITVAATTTVSGAGGPGANEVILNVGYA